MSRLKKGDKVYYVSDNYDFKIYRGTITAIEFGYVYMKNGDSVPYRYVKFKKEDIRPVLLNKIKNYIKIEQESIEQSAKILVKLIGLKEEYER